MYKIKKPIIKNELIKKDINDVSFNTEDKIYDTLFIGDDPNNTINDVEFNGCTFKNINFSNSLVKDSDFIDCIFDTCNLSNVEINDKLILRCEFVNCSLIGSCIINSSIKDVSFSNCNMEYSNYSLKTDKCLFDNCNMKNIRLFENTFKNTYFDKCNFNFAEIYESSLNGIDLSNCDINDINIDTKSIKGAIVDLNGAIELSKLLGIKVKF